VLLAYLWLTRPDDLVTHDTRKFKSSLEIWYQLVMRGDRNTPRNAKRFVNKVRYLAMRQRAYLVPKTVTKGERLLRKWLTGKEEAPAGDGPGQAVPESLLVPLAALQTGPEKFGRPALSGGLGKRSPGGIVNPPRRPKGRGR
jgi:hypothetical protein